MNVKNDPPQNTEIKVFVLDTNLHLNNPKTFLSFGDNYVVIPIWTIEELDNLKKLGNGLGFAARTVSKLLDTYTTKNYLYKDGVPLPNGGKLFLRSCNPNNLKQYSMELNNDNKILALAMRLKKGEFKDKKVILVSEDTNMRLKARNLDIDAQVFENERVQISMNELELLRIKIPKKPFSELTGTNQKIPFSSVKRFLNGYSIHEKKVIFFMNNGKSVPVLYSEEGKKKVFYLRNFTDNLCGFQMKNPIQKIAATLLKDSELSVLVFLGKTGAGKTFIPLLHAFQSVFEKKMYEKIVVYRTNHALGKDIGALPGDLNEKFAYWSRPIVDHMELIVRQQIKDGKINLFDEFLSQKPENAFQKPKKGKKQAEKKVDFSNSPHFIVEEMIRQKKLEILPISFLRGGTMNKSFIIFDEGQNSSSHEMLTFLTRFGSGTKIVITGDVSQIDNGYVDEYSNGLSHAVDRLSGRKYFSFLRFEKSERSEVAEDVDMNW